MPKKTAADKPKFWSPLMYIAKSCPICVANHNEKYRFDNIKFYGIRILINSKVVKPT